MSGNFKKILAKANKNKSQFDSSVADIRAALDVSVKFDVRQVRYTPNTGKPTTGWLRGALSSPWIFVCIVIPAILDTLV